MAVRNLLLAGAAALAWAVPAAAQHMNMPGMTMPMPARKVVPKKPAAKEAARKKSSAKGPAAGKPKGGPAKTALPKAQAPASGGMTMPMGHGDKPMSMPRPAEPAPGTAMPMDQSRMHMPMPDSSQMEHGQMGQMTMPMGERSGHAMQMPAALGPYPPTRESSGTAWQPDSSGHSGIMKMSGDWMLMAHGTLNLVYDHQFGPRGDDKGFVSGMLMGMASRPLGNGTVQFRAKLSPDPFMGKRGYPLLLATGETANGADPLVDRQHPHDLFMELSASVSQNIGEKSSVFFYGGLPGEPAFGPPAFMHRESIMDSPEAPITHHWLDSTHISFGVLTGGIVLDRVKLEVSRFNAREPDQHRWNIETGPLDSTSIRLSWNPVRTLSLQGSWAQFNAPEQLEPGVDQKRWSASALYADDIAPGWHLATTLAWGRKTAEHHSDDGFAAEASLKRDGWMVFGRGELVDNRELLGLDDHSTAYRVGKIGLGLVKDLPVADHVSLGAGALFSVNFVPDSIASLYGGNNPVGAMGFARLTIH
jgi:hypothetical protein